jgi:glycosyltransferase involved in cell wall biosynthesis
VEYLYEAFKSNENLIDYKLVIAGKGAIYFPHTNDSRVVFINRFIEDEEIKSLFIGASCVVYPYISATQSGVLAFAYQFQTLALVSNIPFFREVSNEKCCLFFQPSNKDDLSKKLEQLLFQTDRKEMKSAQKAYYEDNYSDHALVTSIEKIY